VDSIVVYDKNDNKLERIYSQHHITSTNLVLFVFGRMFSAAAAAAPDI